MSDKTRIEWADATWNPTTGCTRVSPGCTNCYIETTPPFRIAGDKFRKYCPRCKGHGIVDASERACPECEGEGSWESHEIGATTGVNLWPARLDQPLRWRKPRRVFVNSLSDLFHEDIPDEYIARVFAVMALAGQHAFQVLTKRHGRMRSLLNSKGFQEIVRNTRERLGAQAVPDWRWPLLNVWIGVTVEDQARADLRIPALLDTPAAVRFLSCEPLLGPIDLQRPRPHSCSEECIPRQSVCPPWYSQLVDWVIVGGESGKDARPMHPDWARSLRDQCTAAGVPYFFKQRGEWTWNEPGTFKLPLQPYSARVAAMHPAGMTALTKDNPFDPFKAGHQGWATRIERVGKKAAGRLLDGRTWDEYPQAMSL